MHKSLISAVLAVVSVSAGAASAQPLQLDRALAGPGDARMVQAQMHTGCYQGERRGDCRDRSRWEQGGQHGHYAWRDGHYVNDDAGAAVAGSILGFALGAAIAGSNDDYSYYQSHRGDHGWRTRCRTAYSNFDWNSGTYMGPDGYRHYCRS